ncbi:MAG: diadenylate cyclase CdaA [Clostridia bacterium]|nr:diadenylate cyclase CdaA [Clostridia bacterium]
MIVDAVSNIRIFDVIDILIIAFLVYNADGFFRENRAGPLVRGLLILLVAYVCARRFDLVMIRWLLSVIMGSAIVAIAIIFQPELRRVLERLGRTKFSPNKLLEEEIETVAACIDCIGKAVANMQERRIGALIVFERQTQLGDVINSGTILDAEASVSLTGNIFFPNSPLHDGALIVRNGRLYAAGCILPLTSSRDLSSRLGTRHRAGIGMTENSDAVVLIVSEETGVISIAMNGQIKQNYSAVSATAELRRLMLDPESERNTVFDKVRRFKRKSNNKKA